MLMGGVRLPVPAIAVLLIGTLLFTGPWTAMAQSEDYRRALAIADTDDIKQAHVGFQGRGIEDGVN